MGDLEDAIHHYNLSIHLLNQLDEKGTMQSKIALMLMMIGNTYSEYDRESLANEFYDKSETIYLAIFHENPVFYNAYSLAHLYWERAVFFHRRQLNIFVPKYLHKIEEVLHSFKETKSDSLNELLNKVYRMKKEIQ